MSTMRRPELPALPALPAKSIDDAAREWAAGDRRRRARVNLGWACRHGVTLCCATRHIKRRALEMGLIP